MTDSLSIGSDGVIESQYAAYDRDGRLVRSWRTNGSQQIVDQYAYDALGRVVSHTDPLGHVTDRTYDLVGHLLTETIDDTSASGTQIRSTTTRTYDTMGNILSLTDAK